jgi:two-component system response regulator AtoC
MEEPMRGRILIIDPDPSLSDTLAGWLVEERHRVDSVCDAATALGQLDRIAYDIVLCDHELLDDEGGPLLARLVRRLPDATVVSLSPEAKQEKARAMLEWGVYDCVSRPPERLDLVMAMRRADERQRIRREASLQHRDLQRIAGERPIVAASAPMIELLEATERLGGERGPVLLVGEPGVGKETIARAIHAQSPRRRSPFVVVTLRDPDDPALDATLFGHGGGSVRNQPRPYNGLVAEAAGGTLFIDEISALPASTQRRLVELLDDGHVSAVGETERRNVDVRLMAATTQDLASAVRAGTFHADLWEKLSAERLAVPALRERHQDIPLLLDHSFTQARRASGRRVTTIADDARQRLVTYLWPGNVRELENVVERAVMLADGGRVTLRHLPESITTPAASSGGSDLDLGLKRARKKLEAELIRKALRATGGNRTHAARKLEISHRALLYKLKEYGIAD